MRLNRLFLAAALAAATPAFAQQSSPSVDDIVSALKNPKALNAPSRGIRVINPGTGQPAEASPPHVTPGTRHAATEAQDTGGGGSIDLSVQFATGSAELTPPALHVLDKLGRALTNPALANDRFRVEGHTDTVGSPDDNKALSERRAQRVASYLEDKYGVSADRLDPVGRGEEDLLVPTGPQVAEARNRRVHIVNLGS